MQCTTYLVFSARVFFGSALLSHHFCDSSYFRKFSLKPVFLLFLTYMIVQDDVAVILPSRSTATNDFFCQLQQQGSAIASKIHKNSVYC